MRQKSGERAVVLGGGMAGLLAARVLADFYSCVTVVDRDVLGATSAPRRGVPQGRHVHVLAAGGLPVLETLLPGLTCELVDQGASLVDAQRDVRWWVNGHRLSPGGQDRTATLCVSRPLLEAAVRARIRALAPVEVRDRTDVVGLTATADGRRVTGARLLRAADGSAEEHLPAELVVDATGRGSRAPVWLAELGYERPTEERVPIDVCYATRPYRLPPGALQDAGVLVAPFPGRLRGAALARTEGDGCLVTLAGILGERPPTEPSAWLEWAGSLWSQDVCAAVRHAEPLGDPVAFRFPASVRRRYDRLRSLPEGLLVIGDAVCSLNPFYGQGMTVAALEARALADLLAGGRSPSPQRYARTIARTLEPAWQMTAGGDLAFPAVPGRRTARQRLLGSYVARVQRAAADDPELTRCFVRVAGLVDPPQTLLRPAVLRSLLVHAHVPGRRSSGAPSDAVQAAQILAAALIAPVTAAGTAGALALLIRRWRRRGPRVTGPGSRTQR